jgi:FtsH-binding integral membrane protein
MVIGHFGFGLGAKKYAPRLSLGLIFLAVQFADILWPDLILLNIEKVRIQPEDAKFPLDFIYYPFSHSLLMSVFWAAVFGLIYWLVKKDRVSATVLGICVLSHWFLDLIVHKPDLPLYPGSAVFLGFGLWNWPWLTALAEGILFFTGMAFYLQTTRARNSSGKWGFWLLIILLIVGHIAGVLSPPPGTVTAIGWGTQALWLFVLLGFWVDHNRESV